MNCLAVSGDWDRLSPDDESERRLKSDWERERYGCSPDCSRRNDRSSSLSSHWSSYRSRWPSDRLSSSYSCDRPWHASSAPNPVAMAMATKLLLMLVLLPEKSRMWRPESG